MGRLMLLVAALLALACVASAVKPVGKEPRYVPTPGGRLVWSECLHELPENAAHIVEDDEAGTTHVFDADMTLLLALPRCGKPVLAAGRRAAAEPQGKAVECDGWQAYTVYNNAANATFTSFLGDFTVPAVPAAWSPSDDAILYIFTGLQSDGWVPEHAPPFDPSKIPATFDIIQPVLQYGGGSENGGGRYWGIASWYVTINNGALYSTLKKLSPGQTVFGNMTMTGASTWFISAAATNAPSSTLTSVSVTRPRLASQSYAYTTLEVYSIASCSWFPANSSPSVFSNMVLTDASGDVSPVWQVLQGQMNGCNAQVSVQSPAAVTYTFNNQ